MHIAMMKILAISLLGVAAVVGYFLPTPMPSDYFHQVRFLDAAITASLGAFIWGAFHLAEPVQHSKRWSIIRDATIPMVWILVVWLLAVWFRYLCEHNFYQLQNGMSAT